MLLVKTRIGPSAVHGIGIFADEKIPKGTRIWEYREGLDTRFDETFLEQLSPASRAQMLNYAYRNLRTGLYVLCGDDARFFNHSETPNTEDLESEEHQVNGEGVTVASRDIHVGEEIVSDYRSFDQTARDTGVI